jgi:NAD(P)-dependent dehydrogenase (short-subunit alcohol dehydrogenase family)
MTKVADVVDRALELTIVPSFTRVGFSVRSRLDHWTPIERYDLERRVMVITGATSGIGLATARALVRDGATVTMIARDGAKARAVCDELNAAGPGQAGFVTADLSDLETVRAAADELARRHDEIHGLIHNAGALDKDYALSPQGFERTVASQVLGPFLLTGLVQPLLRRATGSRVLWMSSGGMYSQPLSVDRLEMGPADYDGTVAYARAKRAQVTLSEMWARHLRSDAVAVHAMHPGWADTPGVRRSLPTFRRLTGPLLRSPEQAADTLVWLAADDGTPVDTTGLFWLDRRPRPIHRLRSTRRSDTAEERQRLWSWCVERTR